MSVLDRITDYKKHDVRETARRIPEEELRERLNRTEPRRYIETSLRCAMKNGIGVIAEIKRSSPTKGLIRPNLDPAECAREYERGGAAALSVLTDHRSFGGSLADLCAARAACRLPVIRKEFIVDSYQVLESKAWSADGILLIMAVLTKAEATDLHAYALELGLEVMVEAHDQAQVEAALSFGARMIGINNRDLHSFEADLNTSVRLAAACPPETLVISESGIAGRADIEMLTQHGIKAFLVGETLLRQPNLADAVHDLFPTTDDGMITSDIQPP